MLYLRLHFYVFLLFIAPFSVSNAKVCSGNKASTSMYFLPNFEDYCVKAKSKAVKKQDEKNLPELCDTFIRAVKMQGSGTLPGNRILTSRGKIISLGSCSTAFGASGECLIPFISVAADPRFYNMGDIIHMSSMAGRIITLPNKKTLKHPGYFIVHDTGGAIKGKKRFDFFTGSYDLDNSKNPFGYIGFDDLKIIDEKSCDGKDFAVIPLGDSKEYRSADAMIKNSLSQFKSHGWSLSANEVRTGGAR